MSIHTELNSQPETLDLPTKRKRFRLTKKKKQELSNPLFKSNLQSDLPEIPSIKSGHVPHLNLHEDSSHSILPVVFSQDSCYGFISSGSSVKIYSVSTAQLLSTLAVSHSSAPASSRVTCILLNPANPYQLVVGSSDGMLRIWDFAEGKLLRTLDLGSPIQFACGNGALPDQIFVALIDTSSADVIPTSGIYSISLRPSALSSSASGSFTPTSPFTPRTTSRRMRLAQPRVITSLQLSPSGQYLISLNPTMINICRTSKITAGFSTHLECDSVLTSVAFHPTENYFATGSSNGKIKLWYGILDSLEDAVMTKTETKVLSSTLNKGAVSTSLLHWHAHAVNSLAFTPNGAYLLSGGEEAVLVLWQLHSNHREYVPRLGATILSLSVIDSPGGEQEVVARLNNGTVVFIGSQKLTISKIISGLSDGVSSRPGKLSPASTIKQPLVVDPLTRSLVFSAGHPSSIQFYSTLDQISKPELEISPSNRVSTFSSNVEPTRVEIVCFSAPSSRGKAGISYWMATLDSWSSVAFTTIRQLKLWSFSNDIGEFVLSTRIDQPHNDEILSMEFSPSADAPLLLTISKDGAVKIWCYANQSWRCRSNTSYRSLVPVAAAWSYDSSTYAIAFPLSVLLLATDTGRLIHSFSCQDISPAYSIQFSGQEGTSLLVNGRMGSRTWDILSLGEICSTTFQVNNVVSKPGSNLIVGTESATEELKRTTSNVLVTEYNDNLCRVATLPHLVCQSIWIPSQNTNVNENPVLDISLATINERGQVTLVGDALIRTIELPVTSTHLPSSNVNQSRLFEEIYGSSKPIFSQERLSVLPQPFTAESSSDILDIPALSLPPPRILWKSVLDPFKLRSPVIQQNLQKEKQKAKVSTSTLHFTITRNSYFSSPDALSEIFQTTLATKYLRTD